MWVDTIEANPEWAAVAEQECKENNFSNGAIYSKQINEWHPELIESYFDLINSFYSEKDKYFENSIFSGGQGGLKRTRGFVNYKLKCGGSYIVSIGGVKVWLKQDGFLYIGDIDVNSNLNFNEFAKELKKYCFLIGADTISFITTPGTFLDNEFKKIATPIESLPYGWCDFNSGIDFSKIGFVMADIDTF